MYRLASRLETGELAELYRGARSGTPVVMKLFHPATTDEAYARVASDFAARLGAVTHRGIAQVLELGQVEKRLAIVRTDAGKFSLGDVLKRLHTREVHLSPTLALWLIGELLAALEQAHAAGVIHGVLTPGNVVVAEAGHPVLTDFGALEALRASTMLNARFGGKGRNSYRAPEVKSGGSPSVEGDVYAVGAVAYELLTLNEAVANTGPSFSTRHEKLPPPSRLGRRLNTRIDTVILRALDPQAARRFKSCTEFREALRDAATTIGAPSTLEDSKRFMGSLFPNEVVFLEDSAVPFPGEFTLAPLAGMGAIPEGPVPETQPRKSFIDLPVPEDGDFNVRTTDPELKVRPSAPELQPAKTQPNAPAVEWHAPEGKKDAGPTIAPTQVNQSFEARVRKVEDFGEAKGRPQSTPAQKAATIPNTLMSWVTPFQRKDVPMPPDMKAAEALARARSKQTARLGGAILGVTVLVMLVGWVLTTDDKVGTFLSYLPRPIAEALAPKSSVPKPMAVGVPDQPVPQLAEIKEEIDAGLLGSTVGHKGKCFAEDTAANHATISIGGPGAMTAEIDGVPVCGALGKIALTPGNHVVVVTDVKSHRRERLGRAFSAGATVNFFPLFKSP